MSLYRSTQQSPRIGTQIKLLVVTLLAGLLLSVFAAPTASFAEEVMNQPPVASFTYTQPYTSSVQFDASGSYDPEGGLLTYDWDFGDGFTGVSNLPLHTYYRARAGAKYTVTLTVTDAAGAKSSVSQVVTLVKVSRR